MIIASKKHKGNLNGMMQLKQKKWLIKKTGLSSRNTRFYENNWVTSSDLLVFMKNGSHSVDFNRWCFGHSVSFEVWVREVWESCCSFRGSNPQPKGITDLNWSLSAMTQYVSIRLSINAKKGCESCLIFSPRKNLSKYDEHIFKCQKISVVLPVIEKRIHFSFIYDEYHAKQCHKLYTQLKGLYAFLLITFKIWIKKIIHNNHPRTSLFSSLNHM